MAGSAADEGAASPARLYLVASQLRKGNAGNPPIPCGERVGGGATRVIGRPLLEVPRNWANDMD